MRPLSLRLPLAAALAVLTMAAAGCGDSSSSGEGPKVAKPADSAKGVTLRVGVQKDGIRPLLEKSGALEGVPYKIEYSVFAFGPPLVEAAGADKIDVASVGSTPPIFGAAAKSNFRVLATNQFANQQDDYLLTKDGAIKDVEDLKGKNIGVAKGSSAHGLLLNILERAGLSQDDVKISFLLPPDALAAFTRGRIDVWSVWEPFASQGRQAGGREIAGGPPDEHGTNFTIASTKAVEDPKRAAALKDYLERLRRGYQWAKANPDEFAKAWSEETGLPEKVTREAVPGKVVQIRAVTEADVKNQQDLADLLADEKVIPTKVDFGGIVTRGLIDQQEASK
ncbi:MAG TPA: ABC transporter substrate-binding protein [Thermoleophilaceae bacterium]|nr:ABC transporter substrate-binding protein [Thermoleophilaceae bacterium]